MINEFNNDDIRELQDIVRIGIVSSMKKEKMTARVKIEEQGIVTGDLKIVQNTPTIWMPYIGQWVLCIFKPRGEGDGFIIGGI